MAARLAAFPAPREWLLTPFARDCFALGFAAMNVEPRQRLLPPKRYALVAVLLFPMICLLLALPARAEDKQFGRWTAHTDLSEPGEKLCWLVNDELVFVIWTIAEEDYRGEWLTRYHPDGAAPPTSVFVEVETKSFSGEGSVGGAALVGAMKAGLTLDFEYVDTAGTHSGSISLIGFTKGYKYCDEQVGE
ncbi:hypothetical protein [Limibacillus halophilus]